MLLLDYLPGTRCGERSIEIDGGTVRSSSSGLYSDCVMRFVSDDDAWSTKRLMLSFERLDISDRSVQLTIRGTSDSDVRLFHI